MDNLKNFRRTNYCGDLRLSDAGKTVSLCGWVQRQRDLGGLIFVDLRDRTGLIQLSFDDSTDQEIFEKASGLRSEYVIAATGRPTRSPPATSRCTSPSCACWPGRRPLPLRSWSTPRPTTCCA